MDIFIHKLNLCQMELNTLPDGFSGGVFLFGLNLLTEINFMGKKWR